MKKLIWGLAAAGALVPAAIGLLGNPTFGQSVPVPVPSSAEVVSSTSSPDDHGGQRSGSDDSPSSSPSSTDDHGGQRSGSDDSPSSAPSSTEDHGGHGGSGSGGSGASGSSGRGGSDDTQPDDH